MKSFVKHYKLIVLLFLAFIIPAVTIAALGVKKEWYRINSKNALSEALYPRAASNGSNDYETQAVCFDNSSSDHYFVPNKTHGEWSLFYNEVLTGALNKVSVKTDCCLDSICNGAETCSSCPTDCCPTAPCSGTFTDARDSQVYSMVLIGTQCWMANNLNIGTQILGGTPQTNNSVIEKYCYDNYAPYCTTSGPAGFGGLYTWYEAVQYLNGASSNGNWSPAPTGNVKGICPTGWHLPSSEEFITLSTYLGGDTVSGGKIKSTSSYNSDWNNKASNSSGFSALPGGLHAQGGAFSYYGTSAYFWTSSISSSPCSPTQSCYKKSRALTASGLNISSWEPYGGDANSVRCIRDATSANYNLSYFTGLGGYVSGATSQTVTIGGSGTAVSANPTSGYSFDKWSDGRTGAARTDTNVSGNVSVTAQFKSDPCAWGLCATACSQNCPVVGGGGGGGCYSDPCSCGDCGSQCGYYCPGGYW